MPENYVDSSKASERNIESETEPKLLHHRSLSR